MQDRNPNHLDSTLSPNADNNHPQRKSLHRRAISEVQFCIPQDLDLALIVDDPASATSFDDLGSEDDLFYTYMDKGSLDATHGSLTFDRKTENGENLNSYSSSGGLEAGNKTSCLKGKHRQSNSIDGSSIVESIEAKKAMAPDKLAELWNVDPKRAKRIIANRQSAARSKERKARYILELERKVHTFQTNATTLSTQLSLFQRGTSGLTNENTELKLRLQAMEQQAQLHDAVNDALRKEVERLKLVTGDRMTQVVDPFYNGVNHLPHNNHHQPNFFPIQPQLGHVISNMNHVPQYHHPFMPTNNVPASHGHAVAASGPNYGPGFSEMLPHDPIGRLQGLDISSGNYVVVKSKGPSISANESSSG
ncbi:unnamed protein product [Linum tenue]|uniref:BZIP domain-containing protein n=1 Tax=Linum tenue TaxID=586396 RepID=A0AAV0LDC3_9ROSI|nr:unnamed protein product [Linum tenue]